MPYTPVTITTNPPLTGPDGNPAVGHVTFKLNSPMALLGGGVVPSVLITVNLDETGSLPADTTLYATDDPGVQPDGAAYLAILYIDGLTRPDVLTFNLPHTVATFDLSEAIPGTPPPASIPSATAAALDALSARIGTTVGLSSLDGNGALQLAYLTNWGIDSVGGPYYSDVPVTSDEAALLIVQPDGSFALVQLAAMVDGTVSVFGPPNYGLLADRPQASVAGDRAVYVATDQSGAMYQVQSGAWHPIGGTA